MTDSLRGKVALVTGGSRGIGAACVRRLAADGADVAIGYVRSTEKANAVAEQVRALGVRAGGVPGRPGRSCSGGRLGGCRRQ